VENAMKNTTLRILISGIIFSLISGIVVTIVGLILGWKTATQFSDAFFYTGAIMISIGLVTILGGFHERAVPGAYFGQTVHQMTMADRARRWSQEIFRGYNTLAFLGISGLVLFGQAALAIVVGRMF
jgi:hypothetical protein